MGSWNILIGQQLINVCKGKYENYIIRVIAGICALMFMLINYACDDIFADVWSEPVKFYNTYGNSAVLNQLVNQMEKFILFGRKYIYFRNKI